MKPWNLPTTRPLRVLALLLLGLAAASCATPSERSWIGPEIGRVGAEATIDGSALPAPDGAATR